TRRRSAESQRQAGVQRPTAAQRPVTQRAERPKQDGPRKYEAKLMTAEEARGRTFESLGLGGHIVRTLGELGADAPFPIQVATIPDAIAGRDVLGRAETGSGKTIAFGAALVERLLSLKAQGSLGAPKKTPKQQPKRGERLERGKRAHYPPRNPKA